MICLASSWWNSYASCPVSSPARRFLARFLTNSPVFRIRRSSAVSVNGLSMRGSYGCCIVFSYASAANSNAVDASPSKVDFFRIQRIALTPSKRRPALVDRTAFRCRPVIVTSTFASGSVQSSSFFIHSTVFSLSCNSS